MGFLDKVFGGKKEKSKPPTAPPRKYPARSIINEPDLKSLADFDRYYPLPEGFEYRERKPRDIVVVRQSDGEEFVFLVEEGILGFDIPRQREDGSWGKRTTEVLRQVGPGSAAERGYAQRDFPLGQNSIDDPDIKTFADLNRYYPLPDGFVYGQTADGVPVVERQADGETFYFLIEEELMGFDVPHTRPDGTPGKKTIEVFKRA